MKHIILTYITLILCASTQLSCSNLIKIPNFNERKTFYFQDTPEQALVTLGTLEKNDATILYTLRTIASTLYTTYSYTISWSSLYTYNYCTSPLQTSNYIFLTDLTTIADAASNNHTSIVQNALNTLLNIQDKYTFLTAYFVMIEALQKATLADYAHIWNTFLELLKTNINNDTAVYTVLQALSQSTNQQAVFFTIAPSTWRTLTKINQADSITTTIIQVKTLITAITQSAAINQADMLETIKDKLAVLQTEITKAPRTAQGLLNYEQLFQQLQSHKQTVQLLAEEIQKLAPAAEKTPQELEQKATPQTATTSPDQASANLDAMINKKGKDTSTKLDTPTIGRPKQPSKKRPSHKAIKIPSEQATSIPQEQEAQNIQTPASTLHDTAPTTSLPDVPTPQDPDENLIKTTELQSLAQQNKELNNIKNITAATQELQKIYHQQTELAHKESAVLTAKYSFLAHEFACLYALI